MKRQRFVEALGAARIDRTGAISEPAIVIAASGDRRRAGSLKSDGRDYLLAWVDEKDTQGLLALVQSMALHNSSNASLV